MEDGFDTFSQHFICDPMLAITIVNILRLLFMTGLRQNHRCSCKLPEHAVENVRMGDRLSSNTNEKAHGEKVEDDVEVFYSKISLCNKVGRRFFVIKTGIEYRGQDHEYP